MLGKSVIGEHHPFYLGVYEGAMGRDDVRQYVESSDCAILLGAFMTDINLGIYTARLDPARSISATSEKLSIRYHTYEEVRFKDFVRGSAPPASPPAQDSARSPVPSSSLRPPPAALGTRAGLSPSDASSSGSTLSLTDSTVVGRKLAASSLKAALDADWDDPATRDQALAQVLGFLDRIEAFADGQYGDQAAAGAVQVARQVRDQDVDLAARRRRCAAGWPATGGSASRTATYGTAASPAPCCSTATSGT